MKVLLVSVNFHTAEGSIAKGIASALKDHEIYFFSIAEVKYRAQELDELIQYVDVVHWLFNVGHLNEVKGYYFNLHNTPTIATVHHVCEAEDYKIKAAEKAALIHVVSTQWKTQIQLRSQTPVYLAHLGIAPEIMPPIKSLPHEHSIFKIGMIGFYPGAHNRKRMDIALKVFKQLADRGERFEVVLQGDGWDDQLDFFIANHIAFSYSKLKQDAAIFDFYGKIHALLCTSDFEGGPLPILEALHYGVPVVSTEVGIAIDALSIGGGLLAPKGDVDQIVQQLLQLIHNTELYNKLQKETQSVAQQFYWNNLSTEYSSLYKTATSQYLATSIQPKSYKLDAETQRKQELVFDKIHEGQMLVQKKRITQAILSFSKPLQSSFVPVSRKKKMIKYILNGMLNRYK
jgi:glycosyltransferase involved in cell wall biosynthesis